MPVVAPQARGASLMVPRTGVPAGGTPMPVVSAALRARSIGVISLRSMPAVIRVATPRLAPDFGGARCRRPDREQAYDDHCSRQARGFPTAAHVLPPVLRDVLDRAVVDRHSSYDAYARSGGAGQKNYRREILTARTRYDTAETKTKVTALLWALHDPDKVKLLLDPGAKVPEEAIFATASSPRGAITLRLLADAGAELNVSKNGYTTLMGASRSGSLDTVQLLIAKGADARTRNRIGFTALYGTASVRGSGPIVRFLLEQGADAILVERLCCWPRLLGTKQPSICSSKEARMCTRPINLVIRPCDGPCGEVIAASSSSWQRQAARSSLGQGESHADRPSARRPLEPAACRRRLGATTHAPE